MQKFTHKGNEFSVSVGAMKVRVYLVYTQELVAEAYWPKLFPEKTALEIALWLVENYPEAKS